MNPLPVNELIRMVNTMQEERRREAASDRRSHPRPGEVPAPPADKRDPATRHAPGVTPGWRPDAGSAATRVVSAGQLPTR